MGVCALLQRRYGSIAVTRIALPYILQKGGNISIYPFLHQLFIPSLGSRLSAGSQENFEDRFGKHHRSHVTAVGNQAGNLPELALPPQKRRSNPGVRGNF